MNLKEHFTTFPKLPGCYQIKTIKAKSSISAKPKTCKTACAVILRVRTMRNERPGIDFKTSPLSNTLLLQRIGSFFA